MKTYLSALLFFVLLVLGLAINVQTEATVEAAEDVAEAAEEAVEESACLGVDCAPVDPLPPADDSLYLEPLYRDSHRPAAFAYGSAPRLIVTAPGNSANYVVWAAQTVNARGFSFSFEAKGSNDIHIVFMPIKQQRTRDAWEVVIGGWGNSQSVIRKGTQGRQLTAVKGARADAHSFKKFKVEVRAGVLTVFDSNVPFMHARVPALSSQRLAIGFGAWNVPVQFRERSTAPVATQSHTAHTAPVTPVTPRPGYVGYDAPRLAAAGSGFSSRSGGAHRPAYVAPTYMAPTAVAPAVMAPTAMDAAAATVAPTPYSEFARSNDDQFGNLLSARQKSIDDAAMNTPLPSASPSPSALDPYATPDPSASPQPSPTTPAPIDNSFKGQIGQFGAGLKTAIGDTVKDQFKAALNATKQEVLMIAKQVGANLLHIASDEAKKLLADCVAGRGRLAALQKGCELLEKGLFGNYFSTEASSAAIVSQIGLVDLGYPALQGKINVSRWFGRVVPILDFTLSKKNASGISLKMAFEGGWTFSVGGLLRSLVPANLGLGPAMEPIVNKLGLNSVGLTLDVIAVNVAPYGIRVSGKVNLWGAHLPFSVVLGNFGNGWNAGIAFSIPGAGIDKLITTVLGPAATAFQLFEINSLDFMLATGTLDLSKAIDMQFSPAVTSFHRGFEFQLSAGFNTTYPNTFTKFMSKLMPGYFTLNAGFDGNEFKLALSVPALVFSSKVSMGFSVEIKAVLNPTLITLSLQGYLSVVIMGDKLKFWAKALVNLPNPALGLAVGMEGTWCGAFGIQQLCIGDLIGQVEVMAIIPWLSAITVGGTIQLGNPKYGQNDPITGSVYVRVDIGNPQTNYFYANLNKFTIGQFLNIVAGMPVHALPPIIAQTGFDQGVLLSYALGEVNLPNGATIPIGFHAKGGLNFFGWHASGEVLVSPTHMIFNLDMDRVIAGPLTFTRSKTNMTAGPTVHLEASLSPSLTFSANIQAYLNLYLFDAIVNIQMDMSKLNFYVKAPILGWLEAEVSVTANYGALTSFDFKSFGSLSFSAFIRIQTEEIKRNLIEKVRELQRKADRALNAAHEKYNNKEKQDHDKIERLCNDKKCNFRCNGHSMLELASREHEAEAEAEFQLGQSMLETDAALDAEAEAQANLQADMEADAEFEAATHEEALVAAELDQEAQVAAESQKIHIKKIHIKKIHVKKVHLCVGSCLNKRLGDQRHRLNKKLGDQRHRTKQAFLNSVCRTSRAACRKGCSLVKKAGQKAEHAGFKILQKGISLAQRAVSGLEREVERILNSFSLDMSIYTLLNKVEFALDCNFMLRIGSWMKQYKYKFDFKWAKLKDILAHLWTKVKDYLYTKVPALKTIFKGVHV